MKRRFTKICKDIWGWVFNIFKFGWEWVVKRKKFIDSLLSKVIIFIAMGVGFSILTLNMLNASELDPNVPTVFVAVFTFLLACSTIYLASTTVKSNKQYREREARDRKERRLIALIEWAIDITECETAAPLPPLPIAEIAKHASKLGKAKIDAIIEYRNINAHTNLMMRYQNLEAIGERMVLISNILDKEFNCSLGDSTKKTFKKLQTHVKLGSKWIDRKITDEEYKKRWKSLLKSAIALAEKAEQAIN